MAEVSIQQAFDQVLRLRQAGRRADADSLYRHVVAQIPKEPNALHTLGVLAHRAGQNEFAAELIGRAIALAPDDAEYHENLGIVFAAEERWAEAAAAFERAVALDPSVAETCLHAAHALRRTGRSEQAMARYRQAIALRPDLAAAHNNLGNLLREAGKLDEAIESYRTAIQARPEYLEALTNLGNALLEADRPDEALVTFRQAIALRSDLPDLHKSIGRALRAIGDNPGAIAAHEQALALRPNDAEAHWGLAQLLLLTGEFERGWIEFEWRSLVAGAQKPAREPARSRWRGEPLRDRRILLHADGTAADAIQFARFATVVAEQGGRVVLACPPELRRLFATLPGVEQVITTGEAPPAADLLCALSSLPDLLRTSAEHVPNFVPYLLADPISIAKWKDRLNPPADRLRIGLACEGYGSLSADLVASLSSLDDACLYLLQPGAAHGAQVTDVSGELTAYADAAALIANVDIVVCADNAFAHLAGALGAPVWVLLPFAPDWRWMLDRQDSPWYPTMRLLRQPRRGDWHGVVERTATELRQVAAECLEQFRGR